MKKRERVSSSLCASNALANIQRNSLSGTRPSNTSLSVRQLILDDFEFGAEP